MDSSEAQSKAQSETTEINSDMQMVEDTKNSSSSKQDKVQTETTEINYDMQVVEDTENSSSSNQENVQIETIEINSDMEMVEDTENLSSSNQEKVQTETTEINSKMQMVKDTGNSSRSNQEKELEFPFQMDVEGEDAKTDASNTAKLVLNITGGGNHDPSSAKVHSKPKKAHINQVAPEGTFFWF